MAIVMPKLSDTMLEGQITRWLKQPGDPIEKGEDIAEVETDKANMPLEAFETGVLGEILVPEGQMVPVGTPVARLKPTTAEKGLEHPQAAKAPMEARERLPQPSESPGPESLAVPKTGGQATSSVGWAGGEVPAKSWSEEQAQHYAYENIDRDVPTVLKEIAPPPRGFQQSQPRLAASPLARKLAQQKGMDLSQVQGSGPGGRIVARDLEEEPPQPKPQAMKPVQTMSVTEGQPPQAEPMSRMRQAIARQMAESKREVPHFYVSMTVDADALVCLHEDIRDSVPDVKITITHWVIKACAQALRQHPYINVTYAGDHRVTRHTDIHLSLAVAVEEGLLTPVIHHTDRLSLREVAEQTEALIGRARDNHLRPEDLQGGTFTVSNMGMMPVDQFTAIINPPQAAILAVGRVQEVPVLSEDREWCVGHRMVLTLSSDHRVLNGVESAQFLETVKHLLENPLRLLL
jgi:pyruvate dehydrogenase E2 component (dihydrolipoamide acetyltransferase)